MGAQTFQFTRNSSLRTTLVDETTGHAKYQIDTPIRLNGRITTIRKFDLPPQPPLVSGCEGLNDDLTDRGKKEGGRFKWRDLVNADVPQAEDEIARILWKCLSPDGIVFKGKVTDRKEFLPRCGKSKKGFKFTGPDGIEYKWALGAFGTSYPMLVTTDGKKTEIAKFHQARYFPKRQKAQLVVQPAGIAMVDHIVLTFVFAEQRRRERESAK